MGKETTGKRHDVALPAHLAPGEYGKADDGLWYCRAPVEALDSVPLSLAHTVMEHEDGTITVTPSIVSYAPGAIWHGHLDAGVWKEM